MEEWSMKAKVTLKELVGGRLIAAALSGASACGCRKKAV